MLETTFYNKLAKKLKASGWFVQKIHQGRFGQGFPDCVLLDPDGETIYLELKVGKNKVSALQKKKLTAIDRMGAVAIVGRYYEEAHFLTIQEAEGEDGNIRRTTKEYCKIIKTIWEGK